MDHGYLKRWIMNISSCYLLVWIEYEAFTFDKFVDKRLRNFKNIVIIIRNRKRVYWYLLCFQSF